MAKRRTPLVLAIDIGTSSTRSAIFDVNGHRFVATTAKEAYRLVLTRDGGAELPPKILRQAVVNCLNATLHQYRRARSLRNRPIVAVGASCFWHGLMGTDASGRAVSPIYTWADSRCRQDAARLRAELSEKQVHARTGCMLRASFWPAKLVWLRRTQPKLFRRVKLWMSAGEWLHWQLSGRANCSYSMASGTGLLNPAKLDWEDSLLKRCRISRVSLNPLSEGSHKSSRRVATRFPELREAVWFPAIGDGAAGNLGSGATRPGVAAINFGTSAAVRIVARGKSARAPFGLFRYRVDPKRYLVGGAVSNAGNLRQWCLRELKLPDQKPELLRSRSAHGLTILPFWVSERAPTWPEELNGVIVGLTQATTAPDIFQAATEAVFQRIAQIAGMIPHSKSGSLRYVVSGGIATSRSDMQLLADVLGAPIEACSEPEASLRGAAVFALERLGVKVRPPRRGKIYRARSAVARQYAVARRRQEKLEQLLSVS